MKIKLLADEIKLLQELGIPFDPEHEYSKVEAVELMEQIYDKEADYSDGKPNPDDDWKTAEIVGSLADKLNAIIPD